MPEQKQERDYDNIIAKHYEKVAQQEGLGSTSTMADIITRKKETQAIFDFVDNSMRRLKSEDESGSIIMMDVGCGNGYTLEVLANKYPEETFIGVEKTNELRKLAVSRFEHKSNVSIIEGDIRDDNFSKGVVADILICQRVIINLLDVDDQKKAFNNIADIARKPDKQRPGGTLLFLESFSSPLQRLNEARKEFDLSEIEPAPHNLYLPDDFFCTPELREFTTDGCILLPNFLSTHYFITRVLHPIFTKNKPFKRNSEFVNFFTHALNENAGDYSPLKLYMFQRT